MLGQLLGDVGEGVIDTVGAIEQVQIRGADRAEFHHGVQIEDLVPILGPEQDDGQALGHFLRLQQRQRLE